MKALFTILFTGLVLVGITCLETNGATDEAMYQAMDDIIASGLQPEPITLRRLASTRQVKTPWQNSYSADGRLEAFPTNSGGYRGVAVRDLETLSERVVTIADEPDTGGASMTTFSPDGSLIAYRWNVDGRYVIKTVGVNGSNPSVVFARDADEPRNLQFYDWHPDGKSILVGLIFFGDEEEAGGRQSAQVLSVPLDGGEPHVIWTEEGRLIGNRDLRYSPDGRSVAFTTTEDGENGPSDTQIRNLETGEQSLLLGGPSADELLDWQPDGSRVYVASNRSGTEAIWAVPVENGRRAGKPVLIRRDVHGLVRDGVLSVDIVGDKLFYITSFRRGDSYTVEVDTETGRPNSEPVRLSHGSGAPAWSPDGRFLALGTGPTVVVRSTESNLIREYKVPGPDIWIPWLKWSPDSKRIQLSTVGLAENSDANRQLMLELDTGEFHVLRKSNYVGQGADGNTSYRATGEDGIRVFDGDTDEGRFLVRPDDPVFLDCVGDASDNRGLVTLSPDESLLAFSIRSGIYDSEMCLGVVPTDGGAMRWIHRYPAGRMLGGSGSFTADGRHYLFLAPSDGDEEFRNADTGNSTDVWMISVEGGDPKKIHTQDDLRNVRLHPDGRRLLVTTWLVTHELWEMQGMHDIGN